MIPAFSELEEEHSSSKLVPVWENGYHVGFEDVFLVRWHEVIVDFGVFHFELVVTFDEFECAFGVEFAGTQEADHPIIVVMRHVETFFAWNGRKEGSFSLMLATSDWFRMILGYSDRKLQV